MSVVMAAYSLDSIFYAKLKVRFEYSTIFSLFTYFPIGIRL